MFVCAWREGPTACDRAEMERVEPRAEAKRLAQCGAPTHALLMREPGGGRRHRIEPPAFFRLETQPIADRYGNFFRRHIGKLDRPKEHKKFLAEKALHRCLVGAPAPGGLAFRL